MPQLSAFGYGVPDDPTKILVTHPAQFESMLMELEGKSTKVFDHETSGVAWHQHARSCGLGLGCLDDHGRMKSWYVPYRHNTGEHQLPFQTIDQPVRRLFRDPYTTWVAHNFKFDEHMNLREGWEITGTRYCTQVGARLWNENAPLALKSRAHTDLARPYPDEWEKNVNVEIAKLAKQQGLGKRDYLNGFGYSEVQVDLLGYYAGHDIDFTGSLHQLYEAWGVSTHFATVWQTEMRMLEVLRDIEEWGLQIDVPYIERLKTTLSKRMGFLQDQATIRLGHHMFDMGNDDQLRHFLYEVIRVPPFKKTPGGDKWSVDNAVLEVYLDRHPALPLISEFRDARKIATTWTDSILEKLDSNSVLHGQLKSDGTTTGRLSSSDPNLQNFAGDDDERADDNEGVDPWSIRRAFVTQRTGTTRLTRLMYDMSQIELRMIGYYTGDPIMVQTYIEGGDIHERTRQEISTVLGRQVDRGIAKRINFGLSYGLGPPGLARNAKISKSEAQKFMNAFFSRYFQVVKYREWFWHQCRLQGCQFTNMYGRPRRVPDLALPKEGDDKWKRLRAERQSFGSLIQGTAADLMKVAMVRLHDWIKSNNLPIRLSGNVHDEVWLDCPTGLVSEIDGTVRQLMQHAPQFAPIPILVDAQSTETNWGEKENVP